jgi:hypothetical protein
LQVPLAAVQSISLHDCSPAQLTWQSASVDVQFTLSPQEFSPSHCTVQAPLARQSTSELQLSASHLMLHWPVPVAQPTTPGQPPFSHSRSQRAARQVAPFEQLCAPRQFSAQSWVAAAAPHVTLCRQLACPRQLI